MCHLSHKHKGTHLHTYATNTPPLAHHSQLHPPCPADVNIESLPRRRTDYARILDRSKHTIKLYTSDGGTKLLRRPDGKVERQYRLNVGSLPVAYTSDKPAGADEPDLLYIMDRAVTSYNRDGEHGTGMGIERGQLGGQWERPQQLNGVCIRQHQLHVASTCTVPGFRCVLVAAWQRTPLPISWRARGLSLS
jgi:hypothetical protein